MSMLENYKENNVFKVVYHNLCGAIIIIVLPLILDILLLLCTDRE